MTQLYYLFEIRSIQSFIFATGKLKDMVAASELIDFLCNEPLERALTTCGLTGYNQEEYSPRCAGGAFILVFDPEDKEKVIRFRNIWPVLVQQILPGIQMQDALVASDGNLHTGITKGFNSFKSLNTPLIDLPQISPLTHRSARTGLAAVEKNKHGEMLDLAASRGRDFERPEGGNFTKKLSQRFIYQKEDLKDPQNSLKWPNNFEKESGHQDDDKLFPLRSERMVGLIHADGNGVGALLSVIKDASKALSKDKYIELYRTFSDGLEGTISSAAKDATEEVLVPNTHNDVLPARPLVLGGDDMTIIVRDDLAIEYTQVFIAAFEEKSRTFMGDIKDLLPAKLQSKLPEKLTACAGITFMKASQPFAQCYNLTEDLCRLAKDTSKAERKNLELADIPSSLAFYKIQGSLIEDAKQLFEQEQVTNANSDNKTKRELSLKVYALGDYTDKPNQTLPQLSGLEQLADCFNNTQLNDRRLRSLATLLHTNESMAEKDYLRWRKLSKDADPKALARFDQSLEALIGKTLENLPISDAQQSRSPLADLLVWLSLQSSPQDKESKHPQSQDKHSASTEQEENRTEAAL